MYAIGEVSNYFVFFSRTNIGQLPGYTIEQVVV